MGKQTRLALLAAGLLACPAFAQEAKGTGDPSTEQLKSDVQKGVTKAKEGAEKLGQQAAQGARDIGLVHETPASAFREEKAFSLEGIVSKSSGGKVTIAREGLPPASLDVDQRTRLTLDGKSVSTREFPEGARVRATFQLVNSKPVAVSLDASMGARPAPGGSSDKR